MSLATAKPQFIADLLKVFEDESKATEKPEDSRQKLAEKMANAFEKFIKQADVRVTTRGNATAQAGTGVIS